MSPSIPERAAGSIKPGLRCALVLCQVAFVLPTWAQATVDPASDSCDQATLQPGLSSRVAVTFKSPDLSVASVPLTLTMRQGASATPFTRTVLLVGTVTPPSSDGGGGAVGAPWLFGLALSTALLRRRPG